MMQFITGLKIGEATIYAWFGCDSAGNAQALSRGSMISSITAWLEI
ncbi:MAG: hypothetical protein R2744_00780 [Bacteroidales bacterium]